MIDFKAMCLNHGMAMVGPFQMLDLDPSESLFYRCPKSDYYYSQKTGYVTASAMRSRTSPTREQEEAINALLQ